MRRSRALGFAEEEEVGDRTEGSRDVRTHNAPDQEGQTSGFAGHVLTGGARGAWFVRCGRYGAGS